MIEKDMFRSTHRRYPVTKGDLRDFAKFTGKYLCQSLFFNARISFFFIIIKKETLVQLFPCEICENSRNSFCHRTPLACNFIKKETLEQVFSCEFCEISKNTFCYRTPLVAASVCCRRKVVAAKIEKLKVFIIK